MPTTTLPAYPVPAGLPLVVKLDYHCVANCGGNNGTYELHLEVLASGGVMPYANEPAHKAHVDGANLPYPQGF